MTTTSAGVAALRLEEARGIEDVEPQEWAAVTAGASFYSSHPWLRFTERYPDCEPRYLLVRRGDRLVAALPVFLFPAQTPRYYDPAFLFGQPEEPSAAPGGSSPLLLGGTRQGYASELLLARDLDERTRREAVGMLLGRLRDIRDREGGLAALLYLTDAAVDGLLPELRPSDRLVMIDARARLDVDPTGLTGYRARVSANTANRMRKEMRRFGDAGCAAQVRRLSDCPHDELGHLSAQVLQRYGHPVTAQDEAARFAAQAELLDDHCRVLVATSGARLVGFTQFFVWNNVLHGRVHGLDDSMARGAALYYNLTYYQAIEYGARHGCDRIDLGCDSYEAKVRRGAGLEPLWGLVLDAPWTQPDLARIRADERRRLEEFRGWDERVLTPTARAVEARG